MPPLPTGTVTFLFSDIEGSTSRWERETRAMQIALAHHDAIMRSVIEGHHGSVFKTVGDAFFAVFSSAPDAIRASFVAQQRLHMEPWDEAIGQLRVRIALHTGTPEVRDNDYFGPPLNRIARLLNAAHGGQVLVSSATQELIRDQLPHAVELRDLGEHRLKDLARPERIFQVVAPGLTDGFPALRTPDNRPNNLPIRHDPLLGRDQDVARVFALLRRTEIGLVTLTGPGGTGKTRLSLEVAARLLDEFKDGVWFVDLAAIGDPGLVPAMIASTLGVKEAGAQPVLETLKSYLQDRQVLLVLDNFEQVLAAAPVCAQLLAVAPRLKLLVTSRAALRLSHEQEVQVPPLLLPDPQRLPSVEQLSTYPSIALFVRRAQAIKHNFQLTVQNAPIVAQICLRLDGLPLAIELAAARIRLLPPKSLLQRLEQRLRLLTGGANDLPPRHQTLRAAIDWSFDLLSEGEQRLFARIAVFAGGFSLEAAEAVCNGGSGLDVDVLDGLGSLISKSLLQQMEHDEEPRFTMLETIREYAEERLRAGDDVEVRRKHVDYFLSLAEASQSELSGAQQEAWLTRLEHEHGNLRAAIAWVCKQREVELALRLAGALSPFWHHHCHLSEGRDWLEAVLALPDPQIGRLRAQALHGAAMLAAEQGDAERAHSYMEESVPIYEAAGDQAGIALSLLSLGNVALKQGELEQARSRYEPSLALFQALGEQRMVARVLNNLGVIAYSQEDYAAARVLYGRSLAITRSLDEPYYVAAALSNLGEVACEEGDYEGARTLLLEALEIFQQLGDRLCCAISLEALAVVASHLGTTDEQQKQEAHRSAQLWGAAEALREAIAAPPDALGRAVQERAISAAQARLDQGAWEAAWLEGRAMSLEDVMESVV